MPSETEENEFFERLRSLFVEVFHVQPGDLSPQTQFGDLPQWDSMGHMDLMVALESRFGVEISAETISELVSVPAILGHLQAKSHA